MGYTTDFDGSFQLDKPLTLAHKNYLEAFSNSRRMKRNAELTATMSDPVRIAAGIEEVGVDGGYYVGGADDNWGQNKTPDVIDYNSEPVGQFSLWCQRFPSEDGTEIYADGEKFYEYVQWIEYIIEHFLKRWGYTLNGTVRWRGEDFDDIGTIYIEDNVVKVEAGSI